ncbi:MAG: serpin family protein [Anaerolineae bacterium]
MAAALAAAVHAPLTAIILPVMFAVVVGLFVAQRLRRDPVYTLGLARKGLRLQRGRDVEVLEGITVGEVMETNVVTLRETYLLATAADLFARTRHHGLPVVNEAGDLVGILTVQYLEQARNENDDSICTVGDVCTREMLVAHSEESIARGNHPASVSVSMAHSKGGAAMRHRLARHFWLTTCLFIVLAQLVTGCEPAPVGAQPQPPPAPAIPAPAEDLAQLTAGQNTFATDLYQQLRDTPGNLFFSPYSLATALTMTYAGARGNTETQMAQVLHITLPAARQHAAVATLNWTLYPAEKSSARLNTANALWSQLDLPLQADFVALMNQHYGASVKPTDFKQAPEAARVTVNDWASFQTAGKITDLVPPGMITADTRLVLANAIYFKADWLLPFDKALTRDEPFFRLDGSERRVPMMFMQKPADLAYGIGDGYQAVTLEYTDTLIAMTVIVPDRGRLETVEANLSADWLRTSMSSMTSRKVALGLPKFRFGSTFSVADALGELGMSDAITPYQADFSGIDGTRELFIGAVVHKAVVEVDEKGTVAAAASAVGMRATSIQVEEEPVRLTVDRPFLVVIHDRQTGTILFLGRVVDPA